MADKQFAQQLAETKLKSLPKFASQATKSGALTQALCSLKDRYANTYFRKGSIKPVVHVMLGLGILGYAMSYSHVCE